MGVSQRIDRLEALFLLPFDLMQPLPSLKRAIKQNEFEFVDRNRKQLQRGVKADGKSVGRYKYFAYKDRFEPVDLKQTGDFWSGFYITVDDNQTVINSNDEKTFKLTTKYGENIFGLEKGRIRDVGQSLKSDFINDIRRKIFRR